MSSFLPASARGRHTVSLREFIGRLQAAMQAGLAETGSRLSTSEPGQPGEGTSAFSTGFDRCSAQCFNRDGERWPPARTGVERDLDARRMAAEAARKYRPRRKGRDPGARRMGQADGDARQRLEERRAAQGRAKGSARPATSQFGRIWYNPRRAPSASTKAPSNRAVKVEDRREVKNWPAMSTRLPATLKVASGRCAVRARGGSERSTWRADRRHGAQRRLSDLKMWPELHNAVKVLLMPSISANRWTTSPGCARSCSRGQIRVQASGAGLFPQVVPYDKRWRDRLFRPGPLRCRS